MEENKNVIDEKVITKDPEGTPGDDGRLFTSEEVSDIVRNRLARYKETIKDKRRAETAKVDELAADLSARESKIACYEYIIEKGYPKDLLEIIGTASVEDFKAKADKLSAMGIATGYPASAKDGGSVIPQMIGDPEDDIAAAFKNTTHTPKAAPKRWY